MTTQPTRLPVNTKVLTKIFSMIKVSSEHAHNGSPCWDWQGGLNNMGYGRMYYGGHRFVISNLVYQLFVEAMPKTLEADHLCRRPICVNPAHIEAVTHGENLRRSNFGSGVNARKTHCDYGHELSGDNVVRRSDGWRQCRTCSNRRQSESQKRQEARRKELPYDHPERVERRRYLADVAKRWRDKKRLKETAHNTGPK